MEGLHLHAAEVNSALTFTRFYLNPFSLLHMDVPLNSTLAFRPLLMLEGQLQK